MEKIASQCKLMLSWFHALLTNGGRNLAALILSLLVKTVILSRVERQQIHVNVIRENDHVDEEEGTIEERVNVNNSESLKKVHNKDKVHRDNTLFKNCLERGLGNHMNLKDLMKGRQLMINKPFSSEEFQNKKNNLMNILSN